MPGRQPGPLKRELPLSHLLVLATVDPPSTLESRQIVKIISGKAASGINQFRTRLVKLFLLLGDSKMFRDDYCS